jgi:hypothetical protein
MFLVYDNATNNVLAEYESMDEAEERRFEIVRANPLLASAIEVIDLERAVQAHRAEVDAREAS